MRLIFSRKGFDSAAGGCPSPIFPDGSMVSLPIPDKKSPIRYCDVLWGGRDLGELVSSLTRGKQRSDYRAHLDPDLRRDALARAADWRPSLGQIGASQAHLRNEGVGAGDLFLFFGLFRPLDLELKPAGRAIHALWGWLQVAAVVSVDEVIRRDPNAWAWMSNHPHLAFEANRHNTIYLASEFLNLPGVPSESVPGAGVFDRFSAELQLTARASNPSVWELPLAFLPGRRPPLTFHRDEHRWSRDGDSVRLKTAARGQEFVLDLDHYPDVSAWLATRLRAAVPAR